MHNQNNKYQYCNRDLLNNPEKYNFASFQGKKFLENYLDFRFSIVEKLENSIKMSVTFTELISNFCNQNISKENDMELEIEIKGASETLLIPLLNKTLADSKVDYASYYTGHIILDDPRFYLRTKKSTPNTILKAATQAVLKDIATVQKTISK